MIPCTRGRSARRRHANVKMFLATMTVQLMVWNSFFSSKTESISNQFSQNRGFESRRKYKLNGGKGSLTTGGEAGWKAHQPQREFYCRRTGWNVNSGSNQPKQPLSAVRRVATVSLSSNYNGGCSNHCQFDSVVKIYVFFSYEYSQTFNKPIKIEDIILVTDFYSNSEGLDRDYFFSILSLFSEKTPRHCN